MFPGDGAETIGRSPTGPLSMTPPVFGIIGEEGFQWPQYSRPAIKESVKNKFVKLWPHYFTMVWLVVYSAPTVSAINLALDPSIQYWVGYWGFAALLIPVILVCGHMTHLKIGKPKVVPAVVSVIAPAVVLLVIANVQLSSSSVVAHMLVSKDCTTYTTKVDMYRSWVLAAKLYEQCVNRTAAEKGFGYLDGLRILRLQDCAEFAVKDPDPWEDHRDKWDYLRKMEEDYACSGWCWHTQPLWTYQDVKDPCSITAGQVLLAKAMPVSFRMLVLAVLALAVAIVVLIGLCAREDVDWDDYY